MTGRTRTGRGPLIPQVYPQVYPQVCAVSQSAVVFRVMFDVSREVFGTLKGKIHATHLSF